MLNRLDGTLGLGFNNQNEQVTYHLAPTIRSTQIAGSHVPLLPTNLLSRLARSPLISVDALASAPTISEIENGHVIAGKGDSVLVRGVLGNSEFYDVFRSD